MKWIKSLLIAFALVVGMTGIATAQEGYNGWQNRPHDRDGDQDRDRDHHRNRGQWGYQQDRDHDGDRDRDDGYRNNRSVYGPYNGPYNNGPYNGPHNNGPYNGPYNQGPYYGAGMQQAQQNGYQWGVRDGQVDRQAGRSYRATSNETYRKANAGYVSAYGPRGQYQSVFRQAYEQGYQRGYGSGAYGQARRWPYSR